MRYRFAVFCIALCPVAPALAGLTFSEALDRADAYSAGIGAQRAAVEGAASAARAADALPDPKLVVGVDNLPVDGTDRYSTTRDFMTMKRIGVMQEIPNADKRRARADAASASVARESAQLAVARGTARRAAALAWVDTWYRIRRLAAVDDLARENRLLQSTLRAQLSAGKMRASDALAARADELALADRHDQLQRELDQSRAALRFAVGDAADLGLDGVPPRPVLEVAALRAALPHHAELGLFAPGVDLANAEAREIDAAKRPDYGVQMFYQQRGPGFSNMVSLQLSVDLPLSPSTRQEPRSAAKRKEAVRLEAEREEAKRRHAMELESDLAEYDSLTRQRARLRDVGLPLARERVDVALAEYRASKVELGAVLGARRELVETRIRELDIEAALIAAFIRLTYQTAEERS